MVEKKFAGSIPAFLTAFTKSQQLTADEIQEMQQMIDRFREEHRMTELFMKSLNMSINAGWLVLTVLLVRIIFRKAPKWLFPVLWSFRWIRLLMPNALKVA